MILAQPNQQPRTLFGPVEQDAYMFSMGSFSSLFIARIAMYLPYKAKFYNQVTHIKASFKSQLSTNNPSHNQSHQISLSPLL